VRLSDGATARVAKDDISLLQVAFKALYDYKDKVDGTADAMNTRNELLLLLLLDAARRCDAADALIRSKSRL